MKTSLTPAALALALTAFAPAARAQDAPQDLPRNELPKKAVCVICDLNSSEHGEENVAAGVRYKGKTFYFCNAGEVKTFKKDPEGYLPPVLPRPMPAFALKDVDGAEAKSEEYKGKVLLVDFWATYCKPCVKTMPALQKLSDKHAAAGLAVVGVSIDEKGAKAVKPFLQKRKFTYPILLDGGDKPAWQAFGVRAIPALFLVDREGRIVRQWTGELKKGEVEKAVEALIVPRP